MAALARFRLPDPLLPPAPSLLHATLSFPRGSALSLYTYLFVLVFPTCDSAHLPPATPRSSSPCPNTATIGAAASAQLLEPLEPRQTPSLALPASMGPEALRVCCTRTPRPILLADTAFAIDTAHVPCKFFRQGACQAGNACPFSHDLSNAAENVCKYFAKVRARHHDGPPLAHHHHIPSQPRIQLCLHGPC